jgi:hypothetical protein
MHSKRHPSDAELNPAELAEMEALGKSLRADLARAAERPEHSWMRQRARVRERLVDHGTPLRWPVAAMAALAVVSLALLNIRTTPPARPAQVQSVDADDLLLKDIQHSLAHQAPETLMPASVLVQEMTAGSIRNEQKRDD